jgi:8-oxo-dGTP pyrophosphatase MutT (NUDIX family)
MATVIFYNELPIYITELTNEKNAFLEKHENSLLITEHNFSKNDLLQHLQSEGDAVVVFSTDENRAKTYTLSLFKIIEAAGGIVQNDEKELLFIFRRGKWDLPKGKMEKGETQEESAVREVEEETGISNLTLKRKVGETYHIYKEKEKDILKISHWFYFSCKKQPLIAQTEEDITEAIWIPTQEIKKPMLNTFENIRQIMHHFFDAP